jgi:UDP-N-acetylmuramoyl-L-alanyl-D-glutamate--2,6-diaminopimelate ligase
VRLEALLDGVPFRKDFDASPDFTGIGFQTSFSPPRKAAGGPASTGAPGDGYLLARCDYPWLGPKIDPEQAHRNGVRYAVVSEVDSAAGVAFLRAGLECVYVADVNRAYAVACANLFGRVHERMMLFGVTGTKGKTSTCHLIDSVLRHAGIPSGLLSSLVHRGPAAEKKSSNTTPEPLNLQHSLFSIYRQGARHAVVEVSSIGIVEERLHPLRFSVAVFTNLGMDHLGYHHDRESYFAAKQRLFSDASMQVRRGARSVINADDAMGARLAAAARGAVVTYGIRGGDIRPEQYASDLGGVTMRLAGCDLRSRFLGEHNVYNFLAAFAATLPVVGSAAKVVEGLSAAEPVPGRLERVPTTNALDVFVDYARTPESIEAVLRSLRSLSGARRLVTVIGCSAQTDAEKRPLVGRAAVAGSDRCVATVAHPRFEEPMRIIESMLEDVDAEDLRSRVTIVPDRRAAIRTAIELAAPDGLVAILGKGSERTQEIGGVFLPFDDREVARTVLQELASRDDL